MTSTEGPNAPQTTDDAGDPRDDPRWSMVRTAARAVVPTPPGLVARVLKSVRGARGKLHAEPVEFEQDGGRLLVGERALVMLARSLAVELGEHIGGVHVSAVALEADGLEVLATIRYGVPAEVAELLRVRLADALTEQFGAAVPPVSVHVVDVHRH